MQSQRVCGNKLLRMQAKKFKAVIKQTSPLFPLFPFFFFFSCTVQSVVLYVFDSWGEVLISKSILPMPRSVFFYSWQLSRPYPMPTVQIYSTVRYQDHYVGMSSLGDFGAFCIRGRGRVKKQTNSQ